MDDITPAQQSIAALKQNITQARIVAAEPTTNPEILRELALFEDEKTREAVVSNANTPPEILVQFGEEFPAQLLDNPVFPLLLLENPNFIAELPLFTLRSILKQENVPEYILEQAADKADLEVQLALANNINTSRAILNRLNQSRYSDVVEAVNLHVNFVGELTEGVEEKVKEIVPQMTPSNQRFDYFSLKILSQICPIPEFIIESWLQEQEYSESWCAELAKSPATQPLVLKHLANHSYGMTSIKLAENINTPIDTLLNLASKEQDTYIRKVLACSVNTPSGVLKYLSKDKDKSVRLSIAENPNTSLSILEELANDTNKKVYESAKRIIRERQGDYSYEAIRKNNKIPPEALNKLALKYPKDVAKHPNASLELLLKFSQSKDKSLRKEVAKNTSLPINILETLANDDDFLVRYYTAENANTPINILFKKLARDARVVSAIAKQMSNSNYICPQREIILDILAEESTSSLETILQRLIRDGGDTACYFLARRFDLPTEFLAQLAQVDNFKVRQVVARNLKTPSNSLETLAQASEPKVREAVAQNPNTPTNALEKLAKDENSKIRMYTASKLNLSPDVLEELTKDKSTEVRDQAMMNPSLKKDSIERILYSEHAFNYLKLNPDYLSYHPDSKALVINHYANTELPSMRVKYITLIQPEVSQDLLQKKSNSVFWVERLAVAQNPQIPQNIIEKLAKDCNRLVRAAAKSTAGGCKPPANSKSPINRTE